MRAKRPHPSLPSALRCAGLTSSSGLTTPTTVVVATATTPSVAIDRDACFGHGKCIIIFLLAQDTPHCSAPLLSLFARNVLIAQPEELHTQMREGGRGASSR